MLSILKEGFLDKKQVKELRKKVLATLKEWDIEKSAFFGVLKDGYNGFLHDEYDGIERLRYCSVWAIELILCVNRDLEECDFGGSLSHLLMKVDGEFTLVCDLF